ncbi:MAG TPA: site-specific integrase [Methanomassiliicoccales archaeon]|nr:site-specific integrase [Methanomassiliicoccales archaeon]
MGRYPFACACRRYLRNSRARLGESTIEERERKLRFLSRMVQQLYDAEKIENSNPTKLSEADVIEIVVALKADNARKRSTVRKYVQMLNSVCRECGNRVVEDMLADGRIRIGNDVQEPFCLDWQELTTILEACRKVGGWKGEACRFSIAMLTFLRLRPSELRTASLRDLDTRKWTFLVANPKGKGLYGESKRLPVPDVLRPFVLDFLKARGSMLASKGIRGSETLVPAVSSKGVRVYSQQAFGRLKDEVMKKAGIRFKWKDFRPTGGQLALDAGVPIDQVSRSMRHASTQTTERYYCRARAEPAFARVNEAYNTIFKPEPAINAEND